MAKWPGSVHDSRILRESEFFREFDGPQPPLEGRILGDSGYLQRKWLHTPLSRTEAEPEQRYNDALCKTRVTVEQCIGVLKRRWHCLHTELRVRPDRACLIISVCVMLHNRAIAFRIASRGDESESESEDNERDGDSDEMDEMRDDEGEMEVEGIGEGRAEYVREERAKIEGGKAERQRIIREEF